MAVCRHSSCFPKTWFATLTPSLSLSFFSRYTSTHTDPCLTLEYKETGLNRGEPYSLIGTGNFLKCQEVLTPLLNLTTPCAKRPCSLNGVHQPLIDYNQSEFYGFSEYWYSMHDVLRIGGRYDSELMRKNAAVSERAWARIQTRGFVKKKMVYPNWLES